MNLYIIKVGGSVSTYKDENVPKAKSNIIKQVAKEIKEAKEKKNFQVILVHGAGPFGHKYVTDYKIKDGLKNGKHVKGFIYTHDSMENLNRLYCTIFKNEGLLPFPIQPSSCLMQENKKIKNFDLTVIKSLLKLNPDIIPVLYGDMVLDTKLKGSVVSGDAIISHLAKKLKVEEIFFGSDVEGVFDSDPKHNPDARMIPIVTSKNFDDVLSMARGASTIDVTGGMKGKLQELTNLAKNTKVVLFNMGKKDNLKRLLLGEENIGTLIKM